MGGKPSGNKLTEENQQFDWTIDEGKSWPPTGRPKPPLGPTTVEVMRSCPLRSCFERTSGYERRMGVSGRIGTAFHLAMQSLSEDPPLGLSASEIADEARRRFMAQLDRQFQQKAARPRERGLPVDEGRVGQALEAVIAEAQRIVRTGVAVEAGKRHMPSSGPSKLEEETEVLFVAPGGILVDVEQEVASADGFFKGRIDRVEYLPEGTRIVDYKSAVRDDLPERYERQLQMYALMWNDSKGEWPIEAELVYSFIGTSHRVRIDPAVCEAITDEARRVVKRVLGEREAERLGEPGEVCKVCEFRPWCKPFWTWQRTEKSVLQALGRSAVGFEGEIVSVDELGEHWKVVVRWRGHQIKIIAPKERFPQLSAAKAGMNLRALEMQVKGQLLDLRAHVSEYSELFLVTA